MASVEQRALAISNSTFPFPIFNNEFTQELTLVAISVFLFSIAAFVYFVHFVGPSVGRRKRETLPTEYHWPNLYRRNRPMLYILSRVLLAVTEGLERYEDKQTSN